MDNLLDFRIMEFRDDPVDIDIQSVSKKDIAIIGMAVRFPHAETVEEFWQNISGGMDSIREFPLSRRKDTLPLLRHQGVPPQEITYIKGGFLRDVDTFDYRFFGLSYAEASLMDPCQRLFLQTAWQALEDAGYGGDRLASTKTGVYLGFSNDFDTERTYKRYIFEIQPESSALAFTGNSKAIIASRLSYLLDLKGPSMVIDTTCSSSLVAVHLACQAIRNGDCDNALVGGIEVHLLPLQADAHEKMGIESSDYKTKSFDHRSNGSGNGEGVAAVLLKPFDQALRDGDAIYAVIKGSAINQDGASMGLTAPNAKAQEQVLLEAWKAAGIDPTTLTYIEAHGSGTQLGDPIEVEGLHKAFAHYTTEQQFCGIGSVKTNIGHLGNCAGIAGLIKTTLALQHERLPASLHFQRPNGKIPFISSPLYVVDETRPWETDNGQPRRAGVSSFGLSGTNCHVVLEEAPRVVKERVKGSRLHLLTLSAKSQSALLELVDRYRERLKQSIDLTPADLCYTANTGRGHYGHRLAIVFENLHDLENKLCGIEDVDRLPTDVYAGVHRLTSVEGAKCEAHARTNSELQILTEQTRTLLADMDKEAATYAQLSRLADLYVQGASVPWQALYTHGRVVHLPVYPFEKSRCWIDNPPETSLFHVIGWQSVQNELILSPLTGAVLFLKGRSLWSERMLAELKRLAVRVVEVSMGTEYAHTGNDAYTIRPIQEDYSRLIGDLKGVSIETILHAGMIGNDPQATALEALEEAQQRGVWSLFHLTKATLEHKWKHPVEILLLGQQVYEVTGSESTLYPEAAPLFGLGKVVSHEYPHLSCTCLDLDETGDPVQVAAWLGVKDRPYLTAIRGTERYTEVLRPLAVRPNAPAPVKRGGAYLITGGTGGMALEVARYLSEQERVTIALVSRSELPARSEWERLLAGKPSRKLRNALERLIEIEQNGANLRFYAADVADEAQMKSVIADLRATSGRICGVVHAAGVAGNGFLVRKSEQTFREVLAPKVRGTLILDQLTAADSPDFFMLFSSVSTLMAAVGQGDYTAANAYLDAFAKARNRRGLWTQCLNWAMWKETGMAVDYDVQNDSPFHELYTDEALLALNDILHGQESRVVIGGLKYGEMTELLQVDPPFLSTEIRVVIEKRAAQQQVAPYVSAEAREMEVKPVVLIGRDQQEFSAIEQQLAAIWSRLLQVEEISLYDNFYDLGGNSILATHLLRALDDSFPNQFDITDIFSYPSIALMAEYLENQQKHPVNVSLDTINEEDLDDLLDRLSDGKLSVDEASVLFKLVGDDKWKA
ncbi:SDR family NAD(P)-dependent oxidoreductase [Brevibacillus brevis]|uniref:SDR family NAD(P)-dependent oxidoreductase n=1 Tax=Brevibacillus brevis TaxID=1393 RepID=UPI000D0F61B5|nr:SDR family NAD(P)-dependent oxidoreductase [Brevibacillus brevis]PSJ63213.1 hypothetical protein C7J99_31540 [Brevibacillus brevis]RED35854.1 phosphopantetheine binding protein [Brevibacillus brevis]GEC93046.1 hypothetical protein BBR01nite_53770 [Brevibacillus brevis]VEF89037.1 Polyketide synthase PksL [Brevibacillus brevis]